jgi:hypothetical protein
MKKIMIVFLTIAFLMGGMGTAFAGLKEVDGLGELSHDVADNTDLINTFTNVGRSRLDAMEAKFGKPLASVTRADADAYYNTTLSDAQWDYVVAVFASLKTMVVTGEGVTLPANDR